MSKGIRSYLTVVLGVQELNNIQSSFPTSSTKTSHAIITSIIRVAVTFRDQVKHNVSMAFLTREIEWSESTCIPARGIQATVPHKVLDHIEVPLTTSCVQ
jgi:hypothetical protein